MIDDKMREELLKYTIMIVESMIEEIERQGKTSVSVTSLRKFLHNIETDTKVVGKKYVNEFGKHGN